MQLLLNVLLFNGWVTKGEKGKMKGREALAL